MSRPSLAPPPITALPVRAAPSRPLQAGWLFALALYFTLTLWQLGLPGLHYDEAREAGQNAMELLTGAPVMAYRGVTFDLFGVQLPLMVQEYIGALNVYLALPLLWLTGIGVPNLRVVGLLSGAATLIVLERAVTLWVAPPSVAGRAEVRLPLSGAGVAAMLLLASAPAFVFWSRQGIFVTNLMQPFVLLMVWQGLRWARTGKPAALRWTAAAAGFALYAKLLAIWVVLPFALGLGVWLLRTRRVRVTPGLAVQVSGLFLLPLLPLIYFNVQTGGTLLGLGQRLSAGYYGVNNADLWGNLGVRLPQLRSILAGDFLWYLGGLASNPVAPWLAGAALLLGLAANRQRVLPPLLLLAGAVALSLVTVSDFFITHYSLLLPLLIGLTAISGAEVAGRWLHTPRVTLGGMGAALALWVALNGAATVQYHRLLAESGGLADHSDASYTLAAWLWGNGHGAPIALDWGMDANVRFLSRGAVTPIEIFGYADPAAPDAGFGARVASYMGREDAVFLLRAPGNEVFAGRRAVFEAEAARQGATPALVESFAQRDGTPLFEVWRPAR